MKNQMVEVPREVRGLVEKTIDQTEKAFSFFFQQASLALPLSGDLALSFAQQNVATALEYARKLSAAQDMQEVVALQADFLRTQIEHASKFMREFTPKP
ncbi:phasin family protein [Bradyrhizobium sp. 179]|uniref:phasin family protein n=1 Tax=Bradyrhizobium sp. 179 TaxID=2782648 RepID=UPI001FFBD8B6|nr:phasin family protein [Bradyrhizobium sp. 179]MCK1545786.1 phasin family protein [Bradyrhizobium sp. 179]